MSTNEPPLSDPANQANFHTESQTGDPVMATINPMKAMSDQARPPADQQDSRDDLLAPKSEQGYSAPSAPIVSAPVPDDNDTIAAQKEDVERTKSIRPLGIA